MKRVVAFRIALKLLLTGVFLSAFIVRDAMASSTVVSVYPVISSRLIGEDFTVSITIADVWYLYGWSLDLRCDPEILNVTEITEGPFLRSFGPRTCFSRRINSTTGFLTADSGFSHPVPPLGAHGTGTLAYVTFAVKSIGQTTIHLTIDLIRIGYDDRTVSSIYHQTKDGYFDNRLLTTYNELLENDFSLLSNHTRLQEDYKTNTDELSMARNINYLLIVTTVAFVATTAYFALRKPKLKGA